MEILALGVGEAADPDFPNASVAVGANGFRLLIDCGHSVPPVLWRTFADPEAIDAIVFTHRHPDHCFGLVPTLIRLTDDGRRAPLEIIAATETRRRLRLLFQAADLEPERSLSFPLHWRETPRDGEIGPFRVRTTPTLHAVPNDALRLEHAGRVFAYSGDGRPTAESEELFRGAALLFHECLTIEPDPAQPHHANLGQLAEFPTRLGLGETRLYHVRMGERTALAAACAGLDRIALTKPGDRFSL